MPLGQGTEDNEHGLAPMMNGQWSKDQDCGSQVSPRELRHANHTPSSPCASTEVGSVVRNSVTTDRPKGTYRRGREGGIWENGGREVGGREGGMKEGEVRREEKEKITNAGEEGSSEEEEWGEEAGRREERRSWKAAYWGPP